MARKPFDHSFKIVVLGDAGVGKTALLKRFTDNEFSDNLPSTIGMDFFVKYFDMGDKTVRLTMWDTAGEERFRSITPAYVRDAQATLFVYSIMDVESFDNIQYWIKFANEHGPQHNIKILVGNKSDEEDRRVVTTLQGKVLSQSKRIPFLETSAKEDYNVEATLRTGIAEILARPDLVKEAATGLSRGVVTNKDKVMERKLCCK